MNLIVYKQITGEVIYGFWLISVDAEECLSNRGCLINFHYNILNTYVDFIRGNRCICEIGI